jgi:serine/threonine protein kinase
MSPEQAEGTTITPSADLYALGAVLFHMLSGAPPFTGEAPISVIIQHLTKPAPAAPASGGLEELVRRLLEKKPEKRLRTAADVVRFIDSLAATEDLDDAPTERVSLSRIPDQEDTL